MKYESLATLGCAQGLSGVEMTSDIAVHTGTHFAHLFSDWTDIHRRTAATIEQAAG
jgi:hypothetical protein